MADVEELVLRRRERLIARRAIDLQAKQDRLKIEEEKALARREREEAMAARREKRLDIELDVTSERRYREDLNEVLKRIGDPTPALIVHWLRYDSWSVHEALLLICGYDPANTKLDDEGKVPRKLTENNEGFNARRLDFLDLDDEAFQDVLGLQKISDMHHSFRWNFNRLLTYWNSGDHSAGRHEPKYFIEWAQSKKFPIGWLDWAKKHGFYEDESTKLAACKNVEFPWGKHSTTLLTRLSQAAENFWALYDPADPSTAPTNEQIIKAD